MLNYHNFGQPYQQEAFHQQLSDAQSNRSQNPSEMSGVAQNLQAFIQNVQSIHDKQSVPNEGRNAYVESAESITENVENYPFKRPGRGSSMDAQLTSYPSERSGSRPKQVRFDIRESLKNIMDAVEGQEATKKIISTQGDENDPRVINAAPAIPRKGSQQRVARLQVGKRINDSKFQPTSQSPNTLAKRGKSSESNNTSDSQKPRKMQKFKSRQLALKYKKNADEMRRKKFGIEADQASFYQDDTNQSTFISNNRTMNESQSRETPSFSLAISKKNLHEESSPDSIQSPPQPTEVRQHNFNPSMDSSSIYEEINHSDPANELPLIDIDKSVGMIVKNKQIAQNRDNSRNSSVQGYQPGTIIRQRSASPAESFQFSNLAKRYQDYQALNSTAQIGSIVRNSSQQLIINNQSFHQTHTSPDKFNTNQSFNQVDSSSKAYSPAIMQTSPKNKNTLNQHCFGTIWEILRMQQSQALNQLQMFAASSSSIQVQLESALKLESSLQAKLNMIRVILPQLVLSSVCDHAIELISLRERRNQRIFELRSSQRKASSHEQLKSQLLMDIVDRLNQKLALKTLIINSHIKKELNLQFEYYFSQYIIPDYQKFVIKSLSSYLDHQTQKREYLSNAQQVLQRLKMFQLVTKWRNLKTIREEKHELDSQRLQEFQQWKRSKILEVWKICIIKRRNKQLQEEILNIHRVFKYRQHLFLRWVHSIRQQNKIKRKALHMVQSSSVSFQNSNDDSWFQKSQTKAYHSFQESLCHLQRDIQQNNDLIRSLRSSNKEVHQQKRSSQEFFQLKNYKLPQKCIEQPTSFSAEQELRKTSTPLDINLKYQIHSALVMQQNSSQKVRASSASISINNKHYVSDGRLKNLQRRLSVDNRSTQMKVKNKQYNSYFTMLLSSLKHSQNDKPEPLLSKLHQHSTSLSHQIKSIKQLPRSSHYITSLKANATDVINVEDFNGVTDYIQYGIAAQQSRQVFVRMFETRSLSVLFQQWRVKYLARQREQALSDIHTVNVAKQVAQEWRHVGQRKQLRVLEFYRTKHLERFYTLFKNWAGWNRHQQYLQRKQVLQFKKRRVLTSWLKYMHKQGNLLLKVLQSQSYYRQALMSKAMLGLYQSYLKNLRVKSFQRYHCYRKFFKGAWMRQFKKQSALRKVIDKQTNKVDTSERYKYQREFEIKRDALQQWSKRVQEKQALIHSISAETCYRQSIVTKTFFLLKRNSMIAKAVKRLKQVSLKVSVQPAFRQIQTQTNALLSSETHFKQCRTNFALTRSFISWKEHTIKMKLSKLYFQKRVLKHWHRYVHTRNRILPAQYRERRLQALFMSTLTLELKSKWNEKRSDIIQRQLGRKRKERLLKVVFLKLLENVLKKKKLHLARHAARDFRNQTMIDRVFRFLKRRWLKHKKRRLMNQVAHDFNSQIMVRNEDKLRESLVSSVNDFDIVRLRDLRIFDDPVKMKMYRILSAWKMFVQDRMRRETVLERYCLFKQRMTNLRCFLAWRSIAKYEHSSANTSAYKRSKGVTSSVTSMVQTTREQSPRKVSHQTTKREERSTGGQSVRFAERPIQYELCDNQASSHNDSVSHGASATFGQRSLASNYESHRMPSIGQAETPRELRSGTSSNQPIPGTSSLFDELETIFQKNRKWLDEQREREEFLREMASHYNQRLSHEMNTLRYSQDQYPSLTLSLTSRR